MEVSVTQSFRSKLIRPMWQFTLHIIFNAFTFAFCVSSFELHTFRLLMKSWPTVSLTIREKFASTRHAGEGVWFRPRSCSSSQAPPIVTFIYWFIYLKSAQSGCLASARHRYSFILKVCLSPLSPPVTRQAALAKNPIFSRLWLVRGRGWPWIPRTHSPPPSLLPAQ